MMKKIYLITSCLVVILMSCGTDGKELYINLSELVIEADHSGLDKMVFIDSNCKWDVLDTPDWCLIEKKSGEEGLYLDISILPNHTYFNRSATLSVLGDGVSAALSIKQSGITNSTSMEWHTFPVNSFSDVSLLIGSKGQIKYSVMGEKLFVNAGVKGQTFHGHLVPSSLGDIANPDINEQYTYNPITIGCLVGGRAYLREQQIPSLANTSALAKEVIPTAGSQNQAFTFQAPIQYNSYRHLNLLGVGNLGLKLNELITGRPYDEVELGKRTGLIYSYSSELFTVMMDIPEGALVTEPLSDAEKEKLSYIASISYGRTAFLLVETEYSYEVSIAVIKRYMQGVNLKTEEESILATVKAWSISFDSDSEVHVETGNKDLIMKYINSVGKESVIPINFSLNNYSDNALSRFSFEFTTVH